MMNFSTTQQFFIVFHLKFWTFNSDIYRSIRKTIIFLKQSVQMPEAWNRFRKEKRNAFFLPILPLDIKHIIGTIYSVRLQFKIHMQMNFVIWSECERLFFLLYENHPNPNDIWLMRANADEEQQKQKIEMKLRIILRNKQREWSHFPGIVLLWIYLILLRNSTEKRYVECQKRSSGTNAFHHPPHVHIAHIAGENDKMKIFLSFAGCCRLVDFFFKWTEHFLLYAICDSFLF